MNYELRVKGKGQRANGGKRLKGGRVDLGGVGDEL